MNEYKSTPDVLKAMLRKAREKLASARKNLDSGFYGDVASRAYYAAFHAISAVLADRGLTFSSHAQTLGAFNRELVKTEIFPADTFRKLQRLFEDRQIADYDWNISVDRETAKKDLADAEWLVNACLEYLEKQTGQLFSKE